MARLLVRYDNVSFQIEDDPLCDDDATLELIINGNDDTDL